MEKQAMIHELVEIANELDKNRLYASADVVTRVAQSLLGPEDQPFDDLDVIDSDFRADQGFLGNDDLEGGNDGDLLQPQEQDEFVQLMRAEELLSKETLTPAEDAELAKLMADFNLTP